jgi:type I restriction enzyme S subunit
MHAGSGDIPFLKVYNISPGGGVDFTNKPTFIDKEIHDGQLKRSRVRPGDVLTNIVGPPLGKTATVPDTYPEWNINQAIVAFRAGPEVLPAWLALALQSPFVLGLLKRTAKATAGQFNIALSTCRELPLPIPPVEAQITLIEECAGFMEMSSRLLTQISPISLRSTRLRQAIFRRAFSGKLVPQDPADEPASIVLARLLAQRDAESRRPKRDARHLRDAHTAKNMPPRLPTSSRIPPIAIQQELPF